MWTYEIPIECTTDEERENIQYETLEDSRLKSFIGAAVVGDAGEEAAAAVQGEEEGGMSNIYEEHPKSLKYSNPMKEVGEVGWVKQQKERLSRLTKEPTSQPRGKLPPQGMKRKTNFGSRPSSNFGSFKSVRN
jgi:hypothetical protein